MKVLVAYASRAGSTKGIAEFIGEKLRARGIQADVEGVDNVRTVAGYDAFVIGSALYQFHWLKEAKEFVSRNKSLLATKPVWIFSTGPIGTKAFDSKGRDLKEVSGPKEIGELQSSLNPRDHQVFFGAFYRGNLKGAAALFARWVPKDGEGDFRNWSEIEAWAGVIAKALLSV
jgi:menaquinone-dependent protoporphyrinogen oxidase